MKKMDRKLRISAGAIVIENNKILLVRHGAARHGRSFLVGPGGRVENNENIPQAAAREVKEETGLDVNPCKILFIEDLISPHNRVVKIWFLCEPVGGQLRKTQNAIDEGIVEASWYKKEELKDEVVYPSILVNTDWQKFLKDSGEIKYLASNVADDDL
jgi:8-oxo-dGTP diphosphatase